MSASHTSESEMTPSEASSNIMDHKINICNRKDCTGCPDCETTYIYDGINKLKNKDIELHNLLFYTFNDVNISEIKKLETKLNTLIDGRKKNDTEYIKTVVEWYKGLSRGTNDFHGFQTISVNGKSMPYSEYKIHEIVHTINDYLPEKSENNLLVDIGAGDCVMSKQLGTFLDYSVAAVDIESSDANNDNEEAINWASTANQIDECKDTSNPNFKHVKYDGTNLVKAVTDKFPDKKTTLIMYNHSLHHFGRIENIKYSLEQSYKLCSDGGVLFIREHDMSKVSSIYLNLQHIMLQLRAIIGLEINKIHTKMKYFFQSYTSDFFTRKDIINWCREIGYTFENINYRKSNHYFKKEKGCVEFEDISNTMFLCFVKHGNNAKKGGSRYKTHIVKTNKKRKSQKKYLKKQRKTKRNI